jgi:hypothetical protein
MPARSQCYSRGSHRRTLNPFVLVRGAPVSKAGVAPALAVARSFTICNILPPVAAA